MKYLLAAVLGLTLAGCALRAPVFVLKPGGETAREPRPASEIMSESAVTPRYGTGAIVVTSKERSRYSAGCTINVALDHQLVAGLRPGEQVTLFPEPGQRVISFSTRDEPSCDPASTQVVMDIVAHTTQKVRIGSGTDQALKIEVDPYGRALPH
jgi:hypothetical protein